MDPLLPSFRRELRARAHALHPVVSIGQHGLTPAVLHEIDVALLAHELVKVRVFNDERDEREPRCSRASARRSTVRAVQQIGKLLVLWRARPPAEEPSPACQAAAQGKAGARPPSSGPPPAAASRRRRAVGNDATPAGSAPGSKKGRAMRRRRTRASRKPGKAPSGVPRAAAPRRRRRAT